MNKSSSYNLQMKLKLFTRRQEREPPVDSVAETAFIQESLKKVFFVYL